MSTIKTYVVDGIQVREYNIDIELSTEELKTERLVVCNSCDKKFNDSCAECSCFLSVRVSYKDSFCPIGKW